MSRADKVPVFPADCIPEDSYVQRLLGLYPQRAEGLWMQRVKILGGVLSGPQWAALGRIPTEHTPSTPLHLTTRQEFEIHDLRADQIPHVQRAIAEANLSSLGACGDTPRNITVDPAAGVEPGTVDLIPLAWEVRRTLERTEGIFSLPRKFKISFSATAEGNAQPWISDLGFIAIQHGDQWGFRVIGAGSLGAIPGTGIELHEWITPGEVVPFVLAAVRIFAAHGDREHRHKARLRHVRQRLGDEQFMTMLLEAFEETKNEVELPKVELLEAPEGFGETRTLTFPNGDVTPAAADALGALTARQDLRVRIANHHRVILFGPDPATLQEAIDGFDVLRDPSRPQPSVVACPGTRWCKRALASTNPLADRVRSELGAAIPAGKTVCLSGCPNGCAHSAVADIGLTGAIATRDGQRVEAWNLWIGGGMGRTDKLSECVAKKLTADEALQEISRYLD